MEFTSEMLDAIEEVKGKRNEGLWDNRCRQYLEEMKNAESCPPKKVEQKPVNKDVTS